MSDFDLSALPADIQTIFARDEVKSFLTKAIESAKAPLVTKRDELLAQNSEFKTTIQKVNELGGLEALTVAQQARAEAAEAKRQADLAKAEKEGDLETIRKTFQSEVDKREQQLNDLRQSILSKDVDASVAAAIAEAQGEATLLLPHLKTRIKSELVDGAVKITVLGADGQPPLKEMSLGDLLNEFKGNAVFQRAFDAPSASGAGSRPSKGANVDNPFSKTGLT